eukprot:scaffold14471_cov113-Isochrysis_galbana.AAC.5
MDADVAQQLVEGLHHKDQLQQLESSGGEVHLRSPCSMSEARACWCCSGSSRHMCAQCTCLDAGHNEQELGQERATHVVPLKLEPPLK